MRSHAFDQREGNSRRGYFWAMINGLPRGNVVVSPLFQVASRYVARWTSRRSDMAWLCSLRFSRGAAAPSRRLLHPAFVPLARYGLSSYTSLRSVFLTDRVLAFARTVGRWCSALCVMSVSSAFLWQKNVWHLSYKSCHTFVIHCTPRCHTASYNMTYNCHTRKALFHGKNRPLGDCAGRGLYDKTPYPVFKYFDSN